MTAMRADKPSDQAAEWLRVHGQEIAESGRRLTMTTVARPFGSRGDATATAYQAACEQYCRGVELLSADMIRAAGQLDRGARDEPRR